MARYNGGEKVPGGFYWNPSKWQVETVSGDEGVLEGEKGDRFVKVPLAVMVPAAAAVSFGFVVFLPLIGFALLTYAVAKKVGGAVQGVAQTVSPGLVPGEAHLAGNPVEEGRALPAEKRSPALDALHNDVEKERRAEK